MNKLKKGKGLFTTICTIITLVLTILTGITLIGVAAAPNDGWITATVFAILSICATVYLYWHGIKIITGIDRNTWLFVFISFFAGFFGGILMLIAKIID